MSKLNYVAEVHFLSDGFSMKGFRKKMLKGGMGDGLEGGKNLLNQLAPLFVDMSDAVGMDCYRVMYNSAQTGSFTGYKCLDSGRCLVFFREDKECVGDFWEAVVNFSPFVSGVTITADAWYAEDVAEMGEGWVLKLGSCADGINHELTQMLERYSNRLGLTSEDIRLSAEVLTSFITSARLKANIDTVANSIKPEDGSDSESKPKEIKRVKLSDIANGVIDLLTRNTKYLPSENDVVSFLSKAQDCGLVVAPMLSVLKDIKDGSAEETEIYVNFRKAIKGSMRSEDFADVVDLVGEASLGYDDYLTFYRCMAYLLLTVGNSSDTIKKRLEI